MTRDDFFAYLAAFQRGDFPGFTKYYTDDVLFQLNGGVVTLRGPQAISDFYRRVFERIRETIEVTYFVMDERALAVELKTEFIAIKDAPDFMVRPMRKGESARTMSFAHYDIRDGRFASIRSCRYGMW